MAVPAQHVGGTHTPSSSPFGVIADRFVLEERVGSGGMGEVYRASDTRLRRTVAIKRIARSTAADPAANGRMLHEAQRACALNHPHIAVVYDVIEHEGELFLEIEFVEGKTLRAVIGGTPSLDDFFDIAIQSAQALEYAHAHKIIHGDIKPDNLMVTPSGDIKMLDFGVARKIHGFDASEAATTVTADSCAFSGGTLTYMAPEVLYQQPSDERADIFSLGVTLYEFLSGKHPFVAPTTAGTIDNVLHQQPPRLDSLDRRIPHAVAEIINRCMQKDIHERYPSASLLLKELLREREELARSLRAGSLRRRRFLYALVLTAVLSAAPGFWRSVRNRISPPAEQNGVRIVAVLPFSAISGDEELSTLGRGLVQSVSDRLRRLSEERSIQVISAQDMDQNHILGLDGARQRFSADAGLAVSAIRKGSDIEVRYDLVRTADSRFLSGGSSSIAGAHMFGLEDAIAAATAKGLGLKLRAVEQKPPNRGTASDTAYQYYLRARGYLMEYARPENVDNAILLSSEALKLDPNFGMAKATLGEAYWRKYYHTRDRHWTAAATQQCNAAVDLGNAGAAGHMCLGVVYDGTGQYARAAEEYQRAVDLDPTSSSAYVGLALAHEHKGKPEDAEKAYQQAINFMPENWFGYNSLGNFYYRRAEFDKALVMYRKVAELAPESFAPYANIGAVYNSTGRYAEAIEPLKKSLEIRSTHYGHTNLGAAYFGIRRFAESAKEHEQALRYAPSNCVLWGNLGNSLYFSGRKNDANPAFQKAVDLALKELEVNPKDGSIYADLAGYEAMLGQRESALKHLQKSLEYGRSDKEILYTAAITYSTLHEKALALEFVERAIQAGYSKERIRNSPALDGLHGEVQFPRLTASK